MLQPLGNVKSYFNWSPRLAAHYMMWFDPTTSSHLQVGFDSSDPAIVSGDLDLMQSMGVDVVFPDYYGRANTFQVKVLHLLFAGCVTRGVKIAPCFDGGIVKYRKDKSISATSYMITEMKAYRDKYRGSPAIEKLPDGRMLASAFGWNSSDPSLDIDESAVAKAMSEFAILFREKGGFSKLNSAGAFAWTMTDHAAFLLEAAKHKDKVACGAIARGFDDHYRRPGGDITKSCWNYPNDPARIVPERDGQYLLDAIGIYNASTYKPRYMQIATLNDYEEGTAVREGIDSHVQPQITYDGHGNVSAVITGNKYTVDDLSLVFDGKPVGRAGNAIALDQIIVGAPDGQHSVMVEALPKPLFLPKQSNIVTVNTLAVTKLVWS
jgi:hypothetical protein